VVTARREPTGGSNLPIAFGPIRSRRLGWSLGINNVRPKTCTYSCVYCQVGATNRSRSVRERFFGSDAVVAAVRARLAECRAAGQPVDVVTFVPDGEPTLDRDLGESIRGVAALGARVAVLTNGSLLWRNDVRAALAAADVVSLKVDTVDAATWHRLNRPIGSLRLYAVLDGMCRFAGEYTGELMTETMLVAGINDDLAAAARTAAFVRTLAPARSCIAIPTRPPAEPWVRSPSARFIRRTCAAFFSSGLAATALADDAPAVETPVATPGDPAAGLIGIVAVHPLSQEAAREYLARSGADWSVAESLLRRGILQRVRHQGRIYLRGATRIGGERRGSPPTVMEVH
jgi:wyosine [tRNA(Phe)-imidazoG37] synthetase (radical SAM superfamily)